MVEARSMSGASDLHPETPTSTRSRANTLVAIAPTPCGKYTLVAKVGQGGMAEVFLGVSEGMGGFRKLVVVKRLHPYLLEESDSDFLDMFLDEARLAARLNHPNV